MIGILRKALNFVHHLPDYVNIPKQLWQAESHYIVRFNISTSEFIRSLDTNRCTVAILRGEPYSPKLL